MLEQLASAQLLLIASLALLTAWRSSGRPAWHRAYFASLGALFLLLALDETVMIHEHDEWLFLVIYSALGALVAAATGFTLRRSGGRGFRKYLLLLAGLAVMALGGLGVDIIGLCCYDAISHLLSRRVMYFIEEVLELFGAWLVLLAALGHLETTAAESAIAQRSLFRLLAGLSGLAALMCLAISYHSPFIQALPHLVRHSLEYRLWATETAVAYEADLNMAAYRLERRADGFSFAPYMSAPDWNAFSGLGYSLHLVDQATSQSISGMDEHESRRWTWRTFWHSEPGAQRTRYRPWLELEIPPDAPRNRALWLVLTLWREDGDAYRRQKILSSDLPTLGDTQLILDELVITPPPPPALPRPKSWLSSTMDSPCKPSSCQPKPKQASRWPFASTGAATKPTAVTMCSSFTCGTTKAANGTGMTSGLWASACRRASGMLAYPTARPGKCPCQPTCLGAATAPSPVCTARAKRSACQRGMPRAGFGRTARWSLAA